jgi:uncharacterized protein YbbC (DUF1343 family)
MKIEHLQYLYLGLLVTNSVHTQPFKLGIETISEKYSILTQKEPKQSSSRFALITNHTGKDQKGRRTLDVLLDHKLNITCILAPEHGFAGNVPAGQTVHADFDTKTGIPIFSLYKHGTGKTVDKDIYETIDGFIFDMQEAGMRHYTYLSTLLYTMYVAAEHNKLFIVLDRPNLLGNRIEGPLLSMDIAEKKSFIAAAHIPLRHGMTIGELATYFNHHVLTKPLHLTVVRMEGYKRQTVLPQTLAYNLSPNIINKQACYGYSFLGLLGEVRPFDVGLGTSHPFSTIALPKTALGTAQWQQLQAQLHKAGIKTTLCNYVHPRKKIEYSGLHLHINAIEQVHAFEALLDVLHFFKKTGIQYTFSEYFDNAIGTNLVQKYIQGVIPRTILTTNLNRELSQFWTQARSSFLYEPWPLITLIK